MDKVNKFLVGMGLVIISCITSIAYAATPRHSQVSDSYMAGYVQAIFVREYGLPASAVAVKRGFILIDVTQIDPENLEEIVQKVKKTTALLQGLQGIVVKQQTFKKNEEGEAELHADGLMPTHALFDHLIADPKWPRFTLAYQYHIKNRFTKNAFAPNFGASFPIYRGVMSNHKHLEWEIGIQGGLFAIMDIGNTPSALINADYYISLPLSFQWDDWSGLIRLYHLSTHLGDEFMLTPEGRKTRRINLSYEGVDVLLSHQFRHALRLYGGGGYIIHKEPNSIKHYKLQAGLEYRMPRTFFNGRLRPVTGLDIKAEALSAWTPGISLKAGFQLENAVLLSNEIQLMLEAYKGKSMHGQFYAEKIRYVGIGLHAFL